MFIKEPVVHMTGLHPGKLLRRGTLLLSFGQRAMPSSFGRNTERALPPAPQCQEALTEPPPPGEMQAIIQDFIDPRHADSG